MSFETEIWFFTWLVDHIRNMMFQLALFMSVIAVYFLPWIAAKIRLHPQTLSIFLLNLFLGWTFVGWVIALVWACMKTEARTT